MRGRANATPTSESAEAITNSTESYQRAAGTFVRRTPQSLVLLAPEASAPVRVSGSAVEVWEMLVVETSAADLLSMAAARVGDSPTSVAADLEIALDVLIEAGAVVVKP